MASVAPHHTSHAQEPDPQNGREAKNFTDYIDFAGIQTSPEFIQLKKKHRSFVFPLAVAFFVWYLLYILLAIYAPAFMSRPVLGNINLGVVLGLLQFVTTFLITGLYVSFANKTLDPQAEALRESMEDQARRTAGQGA